MIRLPDFNALPKADASAELRRCCGSRRWSEKMAEARPFANLNSLFETAEKIWKGLDRTDWLEAFGHHPKIGSATNSKWAAEEQKGASTASAETRQALSSGNERYEARFGHIYLVCATGKSAEEMLTLLEKRLKNSPEDELKVAAGEQAKITRIRLEKLIQL